MLLRMVRVWKRGKGPPQPHTFSLTKKMTGEQAGTVRIRVFSVDGRPREGQVSLDPNHEQGHMVDPARIATLLTNGRLVLSKDPRPLYYKTLRVSICHQIARLGS